MGTLEKALCCAFRRAKERDLLHSLRAEGGTLIQSSSRVGFDSSIQGSGCQIRVLRCGCGERRMLFLVKLWEKCATLAKGVDGNPLDTSLLVRDIHVCKNNLGIAFDFVLLNYLNHEVLLGIEKQTYLPFISFKRDSKVGGQKVFFQFISAPIDVYLKERDPHYPNLSLLHTSIDSYRGSFSSEDV
uniref:Uncharacterized protein n=1 Tax=Utricularia reniformis TaxID=192314 RepID=A0A1Y0B2J6_9LAMI|nr:hypothetical protein AEK19_MT1398 [Utricularia reniformis]ART31593.1 hypothetical protein AEK19_MT1398 [Utricularia reniformis]